jgi:branched-chain amino acid transport system substrate-binding protein
VKKLNVNILPTEEENMGHLKKISCLLIAALMIFSVNYAIAAEIVIGFSGPLSGPAAEYGQDCLNGIEMAIREINASGGVLADGKKFTFRLEKMDDKASPELAAANARQLLDKEALAIFDPVFSSAAALLKINEEECGEFIVMGYTSSAQADHTKNDLLIINVPVLTGYAKIYTNYAWEKGWRKAAMVVTQGVYGDEWRDSFRAAWEKKGGAITADKPANFYTRTDFVAPLTAAIATKPDTILIGGPSGTTALAIAQARQMGFKGGFLIIDQAKLDVIAQMLDGTRLLENSIGTANANSLPVPAYAAFEKKYKDTYKKINTWEAVLHYQAMLALAKAIASAGTQDNVYAVRAAFPKAFPMIGDKYPAEIFSVSPAGRMLMPIVTQVVQGGKFSQATAYIWWTKTNVEFENIKKISKIPVPIKQVK